MLLKVNTAKSECSREDDKRRIFAAVQSLEGGFIGLDRGVLKSMTEWLQLQLEEHMQLAEVEGREVDVCKAMHALATLFENKTEYDRAHPLFEQCFAKRQALLGSQHADTLASMHFLAHSFSNKCAYDRALQLSEDCLELKKDFLGPQHPDTLKSMHGVGNICFNMKLYARARLLHEECWAKSKATLGDDHHTTLVSSFSLAQVVAAENDHTRALQLYQPQPHPQCKKQYHFSHLKMLLLQIPGMPRKERHDPRQRSPPHASHAVCSCVGTSRM